VLGGFLNLHSCLAYKRVVFRIGYVFYTIYAIFKCFVGTINDIIYTDCNIITLLEFFEARDSSMPQAKKARLNPQL
jgi:hypothetical protein